MSMPALLILLLLLVLFGVAPYRYGGADHGIYYGGSGLFFVVVVLIVLYALGYLRRGRP